MLAVREILRLPFLKLGEGSVIEQKSQPKYVSRKFGGGWGGQELHMPLPNFMDAVPEAAIAPGTSTAGGIPVLGPAPLSSEGPSS